MLQETVSKIDIFLSKLSLLSLLNRWISTNRGRQQVGSASLEHVEDQCQVQKAVEKAALL
jgi:hypothetical protein